MDGFTLCSIRTSCQKTTKTISDLSVFIVFTFKLHCYRLREMLSTVLKMQIRNLL